MLKIGIYTATIGIIFLSTLAVIGAKGTALAISFPDSLTGTKAPFNPDLGYKELREGLPPSLFATVADAVDKIFGEKGEKLIDNLTYVIGFLLLIALLLNGMHFIIAGGNEEMGKAARRGFAAITAAIAVYVLSFVMAYTIRWLSSEGFKLAPAEPLAPANYQPNTTANQGVAPNYSLPQEGVNQEIIPPPAGGFAGSNQSFQTNNQTNNNSYNGMKVPMP